MKKLLIIVLLITGCKDKQFENFVFKDTEHKISFRYTGNWENQTSQLSSTLVLLYEKTGSSATSNLSVIPKDVESIGSIDKGYYNRLVSQIYIDHKILSVTKKRIGVNDWVIAEFKGTQQSPERNYKMQSLFAITIHNGNRYLFNVIALEENFHLVRDDFNIMAGTLLFSEY